MKLSFWVPDSQGTHFYSPAHLPIPLPGLEKEEEDEGWRKRQWCVIVAKEQKLRSRHTASGHRSFGLEWKKFWPDCLGTQGISPPCSMYFFL